WLGIQVQAARRQQEAVAAITKAGGVVVYDYEWTPIPDDPFPYISKIDPKAKISGPEWLRKMIGDDFFRTVIDANFQASFQTNNPSEAEFAQLAKLSAIQNLTFPQSIRVDNDLQSRPIDDEDLKVLEDLTKMQWLSF